MQNISGTRLDGIEILGHEYENFHFWHVTASKKCKKWLVQREKEQMI
jgi:hypothetical protein